MNLFELFVKIGVDDQASNNLSKITDKLGGGLKAAAKIGTAAVSAAAAGIAALTKAAVDNYAEYEQLVGGVETLFKDSADTLMRYADSAYKTAGLSANEYMSTVVSFSSALIRSLDGDTTEAAELANKAITDMSDNANKMGTSLTSLQNAYTGFSRGNFTMLDNLALGFAGTQEGMQELLDTAKELSGVEYDISSYADIIEAIHIVQTEMGITGTTAKEASETISGSVASMKSAWQNLITGFADENQDLGALVDKFVSSFDTALDNLLPRIEVALGGISTFIGKIAPIVIEKLPSLTATILDGVLENASDIILSISEVLPDLIEALVPIIAEQAPKIIKAGFELSKSLTRGLFQALADPEVINQIIGTVVEIGKIMINRRVEMVKTAISFISSLASGLIENAEEIIPAVQEFITKAVGFIKRHAKKFIDSAIEIVNTIGNGISDKAEIVADKVGDFISKIVSFVSRKANTLVDAAITIVKSIGKFIVDNVSEISSFIKEWVEALVDVIVFFAPILLDSAIDLIKSIGQGFLDNADKIVSYIVDFLYDIVGFVRENIGKVVDIAINIIDAIGQGLIDKAYIILNGVTTFITKVVGFFTDRERLIKFAQVAIRFITEIATSLINNVADLLPTIISVVAEIAKMLINPEVLNPIVDAAIGVIMALADGLTESLPKIINTVVGIITYIVDILTDEKILGELVDAAIAIVTSLSDLIVESVPKLLDTIIGLIAYIVDVLTDDTILGDLIDAAVAIVEALSGLIVDNLPTLINAAVEIIAKLVGFLLDEENLKKLTQGAVDIILTLSQALINSADSILGGVGAIVTNIIEALFDVDWIDVGKDIGDSIFSGLLGVFGRDNKDLADRIVSKTHLPDWVFDINDKNIGGGNFGEPSYTSNTSGTGSGDRITINQYINSQAQTAADLAQETQWEAERGILRAVGGGGW